MNYELKKIPFFGVGLGLRAELVDEIVERKNEIDVLEVTSEHYINTNLIENKLLKKIGDSLPLIPHGLNLSIGAAENINFDYLKKIEGFCHYIKAPYYSDHFALTEVDGVSIGHLSPLWFTKETLDIVVSKINKAQNFLRLPLVLENITSFFTIPGGDFEEPEFIKEVCRRTGCGLLLDLANIHINSHNRKENPLRLLERFPLENVVQIHLAGGRIHRHNNMFYDTHSEELNGINEGIWQLLEYVAGKCDIKTVIIERDDNFKENFEEMIMTDIERAQKILNRRPATESKSSI